MNIGEKMIDTEKFLDLVQNHHHQGSLTDGEGNYCYVGAIFHSFDKKNGKRIGQITRKMISPEYTTIGSWNDKTSHKDIMLVAKKAVRELELENNNI